MEIIDTVPLVDGQDVIRGNLRLGLLPQLWMHLKRVCFWIFDEN